MFFTRERYTSSSPLQEEQGSDTDSNNSGLVPSCHPADQREPENVVHPDSGVDDARSSEDRFTDQVNGIAQYDTYSSDTVQFQGVRQDVSVMATAPLAQSGDSGHTPQHFHPIPNDRPTVIQSPTFDFPGRAPMVKQLKNFVVSALGKRYIFLSSHPFSTVYRNTKYSSGLQR
jgi:hypothetical protein